MWATSAVQEPRLRGLAVDVGVPPLSSIVLSSVVGSGSRPSGGRASPRRRPSTTCDTPLPPSRSHRGRPPEGDPGPDGSRAAITTTLNTYGHLFPRLDVALADGLETVRADALAARVRHAEGSAVIPDRQSTTR